jgi:hypothetical protein
MRVGIELTKLREGTVGEYLARFLFGGLVTVVDSLIARRYGPVVGGLFLAFPGIFPAAVSMNEKHARKRKAESGEHGTLFGRAEASVEAAGAAAGALGLAAFALTLWTGLPRHGLSMILWLAMVAWLGTSIVFWWLRERL